MRLVIASARIANLDRKVLEPQKQLLGTTLPQERRALCCSVVGFREPVPSGLGFDAPFLFGAGEVKLLTLGSTPMADEWYYAKGDEKHGPLTGLDLKQLADSGELAAIDLVWKAGMADWRPANTVKGLFVESPPPNPQPPPRPPEPKPQGESTYMPDLGTTAKSLFAAATAKAKEMSDAVEEQKAQWREQRNSEGPPPVASETARGAATGQPVPKWALWTAGGGCVALVSICLACGLLGAVIEHFGISGKPTTNGYTSDDGTSGYMMDATELPPPVSKAIDDGKAVWQLLGYQEGEDDRTLYVVLNNGTLDLLVPVERQSKDAATTYHGKRNAPDQDVFGWRKYKPEYEGSTGKVRIEREWRLAQDGNEWTLTKSQRTETTPTITDTETQIDITIDEEVGEGFWKMARTKHTKYRGAMARFEDKTEREHDEGGFYPVPRH